MNHKKIFQQISKLIIDVYENSGMPNKLTTENVDENMVFVEFGWDDLDIIDFVTRVESKFETDIPEEIEFNLKRHTVGYLVDYLDKKTNGGK